MYDVIIVGGGLAGCSSAIHLASRGVKVLLLERGRFPSHKICGEFLSVEVGSLLQRMGLLDTVVSAGASSINSVEITSASGRVWQSKLPGTAYGLSRYLFDQMLFERASECGADARAEVNVLDISGNLDSGFEVKTSNGTFYSKMVIGAFGKRSALDQMVGRHRNAKAEEFVGFKQHYCGPGPIGTVEVHTFDRGYCGINRIENDTVNVCWLAHRSVLDECGGGRNSVVQLVMSRNPHLKARLDALIPIPDTLCAIGNVSLAHKGPFAGDICLVGDSVQMIAPFCGDGMGMALRTGEMAAPLCAGFLDGQLTARQFMQSYGKAWNNEFRLRLALGEFLQKAALSRYSASAALLALSAAPKVGDWLIEKTRGANRGHTEDRLPNSNKHASIVSPGPNASAIPRS